MITNDLDSEKKQIKNYLIDNIPKLSAIFTKFIFLFIGCNSVDRLINYN